MGIYQAPMAEKMRKSVGNVTYYVMHGKTFAKAKVANMKNANTPKQRRQRAIFGLLITLSRVLIQTTRIGFPERERRHSSSNEFVKRNKYFVTVDENYEATIDLEKLQVSRGVLSRHFKITATYDDATRIITFQQEAPSQSGFTANPKDLIYATLLETAENLSEIVPLRARGESGGTSVELPEFWKSENCKIYLFATSEDGRTASSTQLLEIKTT